MNTSKINWYDFIILKSEWYLITLTFICLIISIILGAFLPHLMTELSINYTQSDLFTESMFQLLILFIFTYLNRIAYELIVNKYVQKLIFFIRNECYNKWLLNYDAHTEKNQNLDKYPQGEILARIINDTEALRELITSGSFGLFIDLFFVLSCLVSFISINTVSGVFLAIAEVLAAILLIWGSKFMRTIFHSVRSAQALMSRSLANTIGGVRESFYTNHGNYATKSANKSATNFLEKQLKANFWDASYYSMAESLYPILLALVILILPYSKIFEAAIIFAITDLIQRSIGPIKSLTGKIANVQRSLAGISRINEFLIDVSNGLSSHESSKKPPLLDFNSMDINIPFFTYRKDSLQSEFSLSEIKMKAQHGELIGIVGKSGCGKSTLLNILAANIIPKNFQFNIKAKSKNGNFSFSHKNISDISKYRNHISIITQDSHIFSESVAFNITLKRDPPDDFSPFWKGIVKQLSYIEEWGITPSDILNPHEISVGQKQLLNALRSCYLKRPIILFDEISSALDSKLELALRKVILLIQKNSLTIVVTHRLETVKQADQIIAMEDGRINSKGRHDKIL